MEERYLKDMIERFFNVELTVEEEQALCRYLRENEVPTELRKDKEAIIALCGEPEEVELPQGAAQRLEAMLDELEEVQTCLSPRSSEDIQLVSQHRFTMLRMTKYLLRAACVAAVVALSYVVFTYEDSVHTDEVAWTTIHSDIDEEEDTFDNPEDAMQCLMAAYKDVMLVMNATRDNAREAHRTLEYSAATCRDISKLEPIKSNDL